MGARPAAVAARANAPAGAEATPASHSASASASAGPSPLSGTLPQLPVHGRRTWLLVAALLAGAVTALIVILVLHYLDDHSHGDGSHHFDAPAAPMESASAEEPAERGMDAPTGADSLPVAPEPPIADELEPDREPSRERRRRPTSERPSTTAMAATAPTPAEPPQSPLERAAASLEAGDAPGCVQQLEGFGSSPSVLRLRADCLLRAGERSEAVKSYERFCQRYPDHPAIPQVRAVVSRHGGHCR